MRWFLLGVGILVPQAAFASVAITEIAWMGSTASPNHEWIELHNTGDAVDLDGWILHDANNLTIELSGTLGSGQYAVLERTSDASASGSAFLIYTGALSNTGATLVLRNAVGQVVNQVTGGTDWQTVGGNNETKDTAQLSTAGWITAPATPGSAAAAGAAPTVVVTEETPAPTTTSESSSERIVRQGTATTYELVLPDVSLELAVDAPLVTHVGEPVTFMAIASGVGKTITDSLQYQWSMGNGEQVIGKEPTYVYDHPGEYVVVVSGEYKRQKQYQRHLITVLPVTLELQEVDGLYVISNHGDTEIDLGGYTLTGTHTHKIPAHTIILPKASVVVPLKVVGVTPAMVALYDQRGVMVATKFPFVYTASPPIASTHVSATAQPLVGQSTRVSTAAVATPAVTRQFGFVGDQPLVPPASIEPGVVLKETSFEQPPELQPVTTQTPMPHPQWPLVALGVLLLASTIAIYLVPQKPDSAPWD